MTCGARLGPAGPRAFLSKIDDYDRVPATTFPRRHQNLVANSGKVAGKRVIGGPYLIAPIGVRQNESSPTHLRR
jgi:hypothetical protein